MDAIEQALRALLDCYTSLVNCGDCGNWNPEMDAEVIAARAALASLEHLSEARNARGVEGGVTAEHWREAMRRSGYYIGEAEFHCIAARANELVRGGK